MTQTSLADLSIHQLATRIRERKVSPVELTEACLARIDATDQKLHAFSDLWREEAIAAASKAEQEIAEGGWRGPLHGIPVALKDLLEVAPYRTTVGSLHLKDRISTVTATVVERLMASGTVLFGKVNMVEFAFGGWGTNAHLGAPWNPWDLDVHRSPGGSSSGSGVAVAAGMVPFSIGSDTGGSIRSPASMNGIVGLKPTISNVSTYGVFPLSQTLDSIGPLARSVEDAALVFSAIAGHDIRDPGTYAANPPDTLISLRAGIKGLKLGYVGPKQLPEVADEVLETYQSTLETLRSLGATLVELRLPRAPVEYCIGASHVIRTEGYANLGELADNHEAKLDPFVRKRILAGGGGSAVDYAARLIERREDTRAFHEALLGFDALVLPTTPIASPPLSGIDEDNMPLSDLTRFVNYLGLCALAVPCGQSADRMPLSLQIVGRECREDMILRVGWAFEQATPWHERRPDLSSLLS